MNRKIMALAGLGIALLITTSAGCYGGVGYTTSVSASYQVPASAHLAYAGNGLWVVADQPHPTFYASGYYWLYGDGIWYRSAYYDRGWARTYNVPPAIYRIDQPRVYVRYHVRPGVRVVTVRDHSRVYRNAGRGHKRGWRDYRYH